MIRAFWIAVFAVALTAAAERPKQPEAYFRVVPAGFRVEVRTPAPLPDNISIGETRVLAILDNKTAVILAAAASEATPNDRSTFRVDLPPDLPLKTAAGLRLVVTNFQNGESNGPAGFTVDPKIEFSAVVGKSMCADFPGAQLSITVQAADIFPDSFIEERVKKMVSDLQTLSGKDGGIVAVKTLGSLEPVNRRVLNTRFATSKKAFILCLKAEPFEPEAAEYQVTWIPPAQAPFELRGRIEGTVPGRVTEAAAVASGDKNQPGTRKFERNLDASGLFGSSVGDVSANGRTVRSRKSQAVLDLRLAPLLNWRATPVKKERAPIWWWTPIAIDAKIANGSITKDTLALNRIVVSSEAEMRYYFNTNRSPDLMRHIFRAANASDRDFKQAEAKVVYEFQPILGALNRPVRMLIDKTGKKPVLIEDKRSFGSEFVPVFGAEVGRTYTQRRAAVPFPGDKAIRRFYFGGQLNLRLTAYAKLSLTDRLYLRGEAWERDPQHNYFSGELEFPISGVAGQDFFISFERGGQPPFASADVNAVKLGYRIRMNGWLQRTR